MQIMKKQCWLFTLLLLLVTFAYFYQEAFIRPAILSSAKANIFAGEAISTLCLSSFTLLFGMLFFSNQSSPNPQTLAHPQNKKGMVGNLKKMNMEKHLAHKSQEVAWFEEQIAQQDKALQEVKELVGKTNRWQNLAQMQNICSMIEESVNNEFDIEEDWLRFRIIFEQLYPNFFPGLKKEFKALTNSDLCICALLKLNLNTKDMADLLGITVDSVKKRRYRLRQKLSLQRETNLVEYIINFV
ncbi:helix-turn-helix transcriptional regulator [Microscilla marina]|uniref:HTH luxR-type domain-containing protein n=1 Tax=Microscilla marina ATCC 23134 TaxID=313606 RepID=A1ZUK0_MICM2|nr:hypothetical protein [Microscilla marina]EAY25886.1 conserved hypothetical protein [Microscilla marina ATCC 23134]